MAAMLDVTEFREWEAALAARCLRVSFLGDANRLTYERICELRNIVRSDAYYSVYAAFVQASGTGKTRTVLEMSRLGVYICYCSLASRTSTASPSRTRFLADMLASMSAEVEAVLYLKAWMQTLKKYLESSTSASAWMQSQLNGGDIADEVARDWSGLIEDNKGQVMEEQSQGGLEMPLDRDSRNLALIELDMKDVSSAIARVESEAMECGSDNEYDQQVRVVFVFDEARGLLADSSDLKRVRTSPFYCIRRALRAFFPKISKAFFALVLDTDAKMSNFLPADDNSARARPFGTDLLPPIYYLPTIALHVPEPGLRMQEYARPATWLRYGRPIWAARMDSDPSAEHVKCQSVLQLAALKLVRTLKGTFQGQAVHVLAGAMTQSQAMAMLCAAAGLDICPRSVLAQTMTASHMSIVLRMTTDRLMMFVATPPEPILSEAAADFLSSSEIVQVGALKHMLEALKQGYVTAGPRGEFVAKFILVAAVWSLKQDYCLQPIKAEVYLRRLLYNGAHDRSVFSKLKARLASFMEGFIFFNSFVIVREPPAAAVLKRCWASGNAIMYKAESNMPGADLIVPVWTPAGMTAIVVSVKNLQRAGWLEKVSVEKLKGEFTQIQVAANLPVVTVVMSLREPIAHDDSTNWLLWEEDDVMAKDSHLTCYGISGNYSFIPSAVKELLRQVLVTVPDPLHGTTDLERKWIVGMLPDISTQAEQF